jgi:acetyltransferase
MRHRLGVPIVQIPPDAFDAFFKPRGVVLVGASRDPAKLGFGVARNLAGGDYPGEVSFVNPKMQGELFGQTVYPAVGDVPDPVDLAILLVPAALTPAMLSACGKRGIQAAVISSGGFGEAGGAGADLEAECLAVAAEYNMRLLGPNCIGIIDTHNRLNTTFLAPPGPDQGEIALVSHSGAMCAAAIDWLVGRGFGLSKLISLGNQLDLDEADALEMVASDAATRVVAMYLETTADGRRLVEVARGLTIPVVALKVGRSEAGIRAVASHTGALAGSEQAYRAAFRRAGIVRAPTTEAMLDAARTLAWAPLPAGRRMAVLTNAGGPGVTAADALVGAGLGLADLSAATRRDLARSLPAGAGVANPVDLLASAHPHDFAGCLQRLLAAPEVDGALVVFPPPPMFPAESVVDALVPVVDQADKPVVVAVMGDRAVQVASRRLRMARIPDFRFPEAAASALAALADRAEALSAVVDSPSDPVEVDRTRAAGILARAAAGWLPIRECAEVMKAYGISCPSAHLVTTALEAIEAAALLGGRVVLKVDAAEIVHKSDAGGVRLGLAAADDIRAAYEDLVSIAGDTSRKSTTVQVQQMVESGQEVIVGGVRDRQFGPLVMFGSGGVEVETLDDVEFALAPLNGTDVGYFFANTRAGRRLSGYRSIPAGDGKAVEDVLLRVGWLLSDHPRIEELEINPLRVLSPGSGTQALDVRMRLA